MIEFRCLTRAIRGRLFLGPGACVVVLAAHGPHASLSLVAPFPGKELAGPSGYAYVEPVGYTIYICFQAYLLGLFPGPVI